MRKPLGPEAFLSCFISLPQPATLHLSISAHFVRKVSWLVRRTFCFVSACFCTRINVPARITFDIAEDCQLFACKSARSRLITHLASLARGSRQRNKAVFGRAQRAASGQAYAQAYQRNRERRHQEALSRQPRSFAPIWVEAGNGLTSRSSRRRCASSKIAAISGAIMCSSIPDPQLRRG